MTYQDNLLPKYHKKLGYDVTFITSRWIYNGQGKIVQTDAGTYINEYGVRMIRLNNSLGGDTYTSKFKHFLNLTETLSQEQPDILFIHGVQFLDVPEIIQFAKKSPVTIYVDNHADFSNSGRTILSKYILQGMIWKHMAQRINPYVKKFYGVLPARVDWLENVYGLPKEKCELLVMGVDDEEAERAADITTMQQTREEFGFAPDDFVIVTGGKIDAWKRQTLLLMQAVSALSAPNVKLLIFGPVAADMRDQFDQLLDPERMRYVNWADASQSYRYFAIADLVVFPGRHSVYWEQAAGQGKPLLCKYWKGTTHVDIGGNAEFLFEDSADEIKTCIEELLQNPEHYHHMKAIAEEKGKETFSYREIARRSVEQ